MDHKKLVSFKDLKRFEVFVFNDDEYKQKLVKITNKSYSYLEDFDGIYERMDIKKIDLIKIGKMEFNDK